MTSRAGGFRHASALVLGEKGLLLRGPSGGGKSALTLALISRFEGQGDFARLVGDDRVQVESLGGRLVARPHPRIAGMIEARGLGVIEVPFEPACVLHAIVDILAPGQTPPRYPEEEDTHVVLHGIALPRLRVHGCDAVAIARIVFFFQGIRTI